MADDDSTTDVTDEGSATDAGQQDDVTASLSDTGKKALSEERKARAAAERQARAATRQLDDLSKRIKEFEDRDKSDLDKLTERATTAEQAATAAQGRLLRYEVAAAKQLPPGFAGRLQGSTKEELEADADALLEALGAQQQRQTPNYDGGVRKPASAPTDMNALIRSKAGLG
ncbi:hypothetical protein AB0C77_06610 [Streptomyces sp. NPDC048629]|uniref:hypothetical protein n=1 Tax=Streptomyces sp. NPDC048629 TaxID=3154824 RepID=UPI0034370A88